MEEAKNFAVKLEATRICVETSRSNGEKKTSQIGSFADTFLIPVFPLLDETLIKPEREQSMHVLPLS